LSESSQDLATVHERAVLVHVYFNDSEVSADLREFRELALSAGALIISTLTTKRQRPDVRYFVGLGKAEELVSLVAVSSIDLVLFNHDLSASQVRNLEEMIKCRVLDRRGLILDIFAQRARSFAGKLQVELAQLQHLSTRLIGSSSHLARQQGGIGLRGPGETKLETDRRLIKNRIKHLKERLEKLAKQRLQNRSARKRASMPTISLVGYTNAGKSTLFNKLTGANTWVADQLFATLDPTVRAISLSHTGKALVADTVGFVQNLPHQLIDAFQATLEETKDADLLLLVVDAHDPLWRMQLQEVSSVLEKIGASEVPRIEVYNKIDLIEGSKVERERDSQGGIQRLWISAETGEGLPVLLEALTECLDNDMIQGWLSLAAEQARIRACLYEAQAIIEEKLADTGGWQLHIKLPRSKWAKLCHQYQELTDCWLSNIRE